MSNPGLPCFCKDGRMKHPHGSVRWPLPYIILLVQLLLGENAWAKQDLFKWSIVNQTGNAKISLKTYCESWRINVELHNLRNFLVVPRECVAYIGKYMTSTQYRVDSERAIEQSTVYFQNSRSMGDGRDAWVFDVDDTLLSTLSYFRSHEFGGERWNGTSFKEWASEGKAAALPHSMSLYNQIKGRGVGIFLISARKEYLRDATVQNLLKVGYSGWTQLILRGGDDNGKTIMDYKSEKRERLVKDGYVIWGNVGDQWSDITGSEVGYRTFKLPNSMYYVD